MAVDKERLEAAARNSAERRRSKRTSETLRKRGLAELGKVASGSATHGLWLRNRKVGSQVMGIDRSRFPRRGTVGKVRKKRR